MRIDGFSPFHMNGFSTYVMNSSQDADEVILDFEQAMTLGLTTEEALKYALNLNDTSLEELTEYDKNRVLRKVEEISRCRLDCDGRR